MWLSVVGHAVFQQSAKYEGLLLDSRVSERERDDLVLDALPISEWTDLGKR